MGEHVAILGAGPIGIDAALAAHDAGLSFTLYESALHAGANLRRWGHVRLFTPWSMNLSARMRARLDPDAFLSDDDCPTGAEMAEKVLAPLVAHPDLKGHVRLGSRVLAVSRAGLVKSDEISTGVRSDHPFRLLVRSADGKETIDYADVVLDCTGTYANPNPLGDGGIPAPGEAAAAARIIREIPDIEGDPERWAGKTVLLVGSGHSGQTVATALAELAERAPGTRILWSVRGDVGSVETFVDDPLAERSELNAKANELLAGASPQVEVRTGELVDAVEPLSDGLRITLRDKEGALRTVDVDVVVSLTGFVGDHSIYRQLQVHECYATSGPMKLAAALLAETGADCLAQTGHGVDTLRSPEPNFFMLGSKSYGRNNTFLLKVGYEQVDDVFGALSPTLPTASETNGEEPRA